MSGFCFDQQLVTLWEAEGSPQSELAMPCLCGRALAGLFTGSHN